MKITKQDVVEVLAQDHNAERIGLLFAVFASHAITASRIRRNIDYIDRRRAQGKRPSYYGYYRIAMTGAGICTQVAYHAHIGALMAKKHAHLCK